MSAPAPAAPAAVQAKCAHFGLCGGCQLQDLGYEGQLERKARAVAALFAPLGWARPVPIAPSPQLWHYRNKMEFSFQDVYPAPPAGEDALHLGLKQKGRWDRVLDLSECHLLSPETPRLLASVHDWARREGLEPYNLHKQRGFLRHLVVREAKNGPDRMVLLLTGEGEFPRESFVEAVLAAYPATTILRGVNPGKADVAKSERLEVLRGPGHIAETLLGREFRVSPHSFFQTNTRGAERLYSRLREWLAEIKPGNVLDLYCGSGGIALSVADLCGRVLGIESVPSAVEDARHNAARLQAANVEFLEGAVEKVLPALAGQQLEVDALIADPPRSGMHPHALKAVGALAPRRILYVSCNPRTCAADAQRLSDFYELERLEAADLFPHTEHVEVLALLRWKY